MTTFIISFVGSMISSILTMKVLNKLRSNREDKMESEYILRRLNVMFQDIKNPHYKVEVLKNMPKKRYIKLGVYVSEEGIADALINGSPYDQIKEKVRLHQSWTSSSKKPPFMIDVVLMED